MNTNCKVNYFTKLWHSIKMNPVPMHWRLDFSSLFVLANVGIMCCYLKQPFTLQSEFVKLSNLFSLICLSLSKKGRKKILISISVLKSSLIHWLKGTKECGEGALKLGQTQATAECTSKTIPVLPVPQRLDHCVRGMLSHACQALTAL